jgi:diguanylate cyclase (GGDEF)-like protein
MEPLVLAVLSLRRLARKGIAPIAVCGLSAYLVLGGASRTLVTDGVAFALFALVLLRSIRARLRVTGEAPFWVDFEVGALLSTLVIEGVVRVDGSLDGRFSPAIFVLLALVAALARPGAAITTLLFTLAYEAFARKVVLGEGLGPLLFRGLFGAAFTALNVAFLRAEVARVRTVSRARLDEELAKLKEDARSYRLLGAGEGNEKHAEDRLARSSVEEIHQSVHYALELLRRTLDLHTAVLLWKNDAGTHLRISELSTASDDIHDAPFTVGDGVLGAVAAKRERVALENLKPTFKVPYYSGACPVRVLCALPVVEESGRAEDDKSEKNLGKSRRAEAPRESLFRGILAIDRKDNRPFSPHEQELAAQAARYCLRAIQNERVFLQLERAKVEQGKLYRAAQALGAATSEKDVVRAGVRAAREIASFDLAAVTVWDETTKMHEIVAAESDDQSVDEYVGTRFAHNTGLVSMVVQNRFPLPYKGEYDPAHQVVLGKRFAWPKLPSLLVLPLVIHDRPLGTLILGAKRKHAFGESVRPTLEVLASHLAVSLSNARMVHKLETMATTDGMTGLLNKRAMLDAAEQKIASSARFGRKLSVLVTDIDFFKKVNDTYGHDVGDVVIKGLGEILKRQKRNTDVVARFGGEEFVVLCEQTDEAGAMLLGERIREELERTTFNTENGPLKVTCSVGMATFPEAGKNWEALFKAADEALYVSKRGGRNRSSAWQPRQSETRITKEPRKTG